MDRKALTNISAAVITAALSGVILYETFFAGSLLREAGLTGLFLASMFSHLTVIGRGLFLPAFVQLTRDYSPAILGFSAGLGAAIGEVTAYYWGLGIREAFAEENNNSAVARWVEKYGLLAVLLVAASPLPDTPIALLAGTARFPFRKFLIVQAVGKITFYSLGAAVGGSIFAHLGSFMDELILSTFIMIASILLCIVVSWSKSRDRLLQLLGRVLR